VEGGGRDGELDVLGRFSLLSPLKKWLDEMLTFHR
jgi:hypothetical protein